MAAMAKRAAFIACILIAALAAMVAGAGAMQLLSVWDGSYNPIRDDHQPPGYMPTYYANITRMISADVVILGAATLGAWWLWPAIKPLSQMPGAERG